jgi:hypothetical protein
MAVVQPLYCWAIPAVRSGYGGGFRIDAIEPARPDQTIQQGSSLTAVVAAEEDRGRLRKRNLWSLPFLQHRF